MAETKRMTAEQVVGYLLEGEGLDFLRESLSWVCQQLMEAEVSELVGAARGQRAPEERLTPQRLPGAPLAHPRRRARAGDPPKLRRGSYFPSFLEPRRRSEQALVSVVQEAYVAGVSTRKVDLPSVSQGGPQLNGPNGHDRAEPLEEGHELGRRDENDSEELGSTRIREQPLAHRVIPDEPAGEETDQPRGSQKAERNHDGHDCASARIHAVKAKAALSPSVPA
jgi:hypothetical protein